MTRYTLSLLVLLALGVVYTPLAVAAPSAERGFRIGFLAFGPPPPDPSRPPFPSRPSDKGCASSAMLKATPSS
jgi:hypothetical protein